MLDIGAQLVTPALVMHVGSGVAAIVSGGVALLAAKGERLHRAWGTVFFAAMLATAATATFLSVVKQPGTIISSIFALYLVATAWATVRRPEGTIGNFERVAFFVAVACAAGDFVLGLIAAQNPKGQFFGFAAPLYFASGSFAALAAAFDLKVIRSGGISGVSRVSRHLWRMCTALFIASGSFFIGQQKIMPDWVQGSPVLFALGLAPLLFLSFWLVRVRHANWPKRQMMTE
jgi:uncharacterized membrane protein